jgi:hypothetical protein
VLQAFRGGRLLVHKMTCVSPLAFPLEWRTGISDRGGTVTGVDAVVLVMDVGSYPVHVTARTFTLESDPDAFCPFQCSGVQPKYFWEPSSCGDRRQCECGDLYGTNHVLAVACMLKN